MSDATTPQKLGRYEIVRELGKGAMGVVYEGRDPNINRRVAIKTARRDILTGSGKGEEILTRFLREAQAAGALNHPNIITIYDADEEDGIAYIAMEFIEGGDLHERILDRRSLEMEEIVEIGACICEALACAHDQGIIHRDIKPANIMLPKNAPLKVADFGIAHVSDSTLTQDGALIGTPHYMSPEQFMGQKLDGRSDLFSVGVMLYEILTGEKPFSGEALSTVMHHVIKTAPAAPGELNFAVSPNLSAVVVKAMSKRPNERYPDGRAMAAALRESIKENPDQAVLGVSAAPASQAEATVFQGVDASATVVQNAPSATVLSQDDATIQASPEELPSQDLSETKPGSPPVDSVDFEKENNKTSLPKNYLIGAGIVVLLLVFGAGFMMLGKGEDPRTNEAKNPVTTAAETAVETTPMLVEVYYTKDLDLSLELLDIGEDADALYQFIRTHLPTGKISPLPKCRIEAQTKDKAVNVKGLTDSSGSTFLPIPESVDKLSLALYTDEGNKAVLTGETKTWRKKQYFVVYLPES